MTSASSLIGAPQSIQPMNGINAPQRPDCVAGVVGLELRNVVENYLFESPPDLRNTAEFWPFALCGYRRALRQSASFIVLPNQRSQPSLRKISNPPISAVQIALQALGESLQFLWSLNARGDHISKLIALAREDIFTQLVVLQFVSCRLI